MLIKRNENNLFTKWWFSVDKVILLTTLILIIIGAIMLASTGTFAAKKGHLPEMIYIKSFLIYVWIGIIALITVSFLSAKQLRYLSILGTCILIPCLIATLFFPSVKGGKRWISIGYRFQPSEFLKPIFALVIAMIFIRIKDFYKKKNKKFKNYTLLLAVLCIIICTLLLSQPDYGMTFTFGIIFISEIFVAGISYYAIAILISLFIALIIGGYCFSPHFTNRINKFLNNTNEQLELGLNAIREAGFFGGYSNNLKSKVPDVHTDFVFSAMVEEFGAIFASIILVIFLFLIIYIFSILRKKNNRFVIYSCTGIISYLTFQVFVNISSTLGILPTKGMTLPFISYGGSSFISSCVAIGIILSLLQDQNLRR